MRQISLFLVCLVVFVDNAFGGIPVFTAPTQGQNFPFPEGPAGKTVTTVRATDPQNTITYTIASQTPPRTPAFFSINLNTGVLLTDTDIDYDAIGQNKATTLTVQALSSAQDTDKANVTFTVTIADTPTFSAAVFCKAISSNSAAGTTIGSYPATGGASTISYAIAGGDETPARFAMNSTSGEITTIGQDLAVKTYTLNITASDGTNTGIATVNVPVDGSCDGNGASANKAAVMSVVVIFLVGLLTV